MSHPRVGVSASLFALGALLVCEGCGPAPVETSSAALTARGGVDPGDTVLVRRPPPPPCARRARNPSR